MFKKSYFQRLDLSFNHLENLDSHLLMSSYNLETLDLSHNQLTSYNLKSANNFRRLQILNLAYNHLTKIEEDWQLGYLNLRDLNVSHNRIGPIIHKRWTDLVLFHFDLMCLGISSSASSITGCFWIFLTTELRSLTFCQPGVCKTGAPCGKRSTWRSRVGQIIATTITSLLLRGKL